MAGNASRDTRGSYCGRAVHSVSALTAEDWRKIEAHRRRERPTPWQALADIFRVSQSDLKSHFDACLLNVANDHSAPVPPAEVPEEEIPGTWNERRTRLLTTMWSDLHLTAREIAQALNVSERAVSSKVIRLGLQRKPVAA
jgi:hypothetical protein